jgi:hypothetical protein
VIAILLGRQLGYTKYCCFLCEWDSRDRKTITSKNSGQKEIHLSQERKNVLNNPLVNSEKNFLPPLHIKLGLITNFVKAMDKNGAGFMYMKHKFPRLSDAKI